MSRLPCEIQLGGSTKQYLEWDKRNLTKEQCVEHIKGSLQNKCRTNPARMAVKAASLIGVVYDLLDGDEWLLDCICAALSELRKEEKERS